MREPVEQGGHPAAFGKTVPQSLNARLVVEERPPLVAAAHYLEEEIGGPVVEGQIPDLVNEDQARLDAVPQPPLQGPGRLLAAEIQL